MIGLRVILFLASIVLFAVEVPVSVASDSYRNFEVLSNKAMMAERAGRWDEAKRDWEQAHTIAPGAFQPVASLAMLATKLGRVDEAFAWLEKSYSGCFSDPILGFSDPAYLAEDENYTPLHNDPRWAALLTKLKVECEEGTLRWRRRQSDLDPKTAPSFKSLRKLAAAFDSQKKEFENNRWRLSFAEQHTMTSTIRGQRISALHRYLTEHPTAGDRADAAWGAIQARIWPRRVEHIRIRWGEFGTQVLEEIDRFLREYSGSPHCGQASLDRAFVAFGTRPESTSQDAPWRDEDMLDLDRSLSETSQKYAGTTAGGLALAWRLILALPSSGVTAQMRALKAQLDEQYGRDREVQTLMSEWGGAAGMRFSSIDEFEGTDLGGTRWTASSFKGKLTLISFWATWCGPCVGEIATIRQAWDAYRDKGLAIVGVSLDFDDRAQFEGWLSRNEVAWPQIWDGKGFSTPLARRYEVRTIPFNVLVDRDGHVTNVNLRGDALLTRIRVLLDSSKEPPGTATSPDS